MSQAGPQNGVKLDMSAALAPQLEHAPRDAPALTLEQETPTNEHWALLATHFSSVTDLHMDSGWNEELNDRDIPLHWPLQRLTLSSACGEVCRSPWIVEGRVPHLVLNYTAGLRFEGPTTKELCKANDEAVKEGVKEGPEEKGGIKITFVPDLVNEWMEKKYSKKDDSGADAEGEKEERQPESRLRKLEIVYNDVRDMLYRYVLAHPSLIDPVQELSLIAKSKYDMSACDEQILEKVLPQLEQLRTLVLVLGDHYRDREQLPNFFKFFPPNLETLHFQSSVSLARDEVISKWAEAFQDPKFLPKLKKLSFVLDLEDGEQERWETEEWERKHANDADETGKETETAEDDTASSSSEESADDTPEDEEQKGPTAGAEHDAVEAQEMTTEAAPKKPPPKVSDEALATAKRACQRVERAAESRGVIIEPFMGEWRQEFTRVTKLDERWDEL
ncbi:hypothetical protein BFW01_g12803 [Lasiodiplodia theobromae]|nr:hypothetical protein BFW01_g12803 [Lasiodiplodia theobromae]